MGYIKYYQSTMRIVVEIVMWKKTLLDFQVLS